MPVAAGPKFKTLSIAQPPLGRSTGPSLAGGNRLGGGFFSKGC